MNPVLVCYLVAPGAQYGPRVRQFAESYAKYDPGMDYDFLSVVKEGALAPDGPTMLDSNDGYDIGSLLRVAGGYEEYDYLMWLGTSARILCDDWLAKFYEAVKHPHVAAAAATGSYEMGISQRSPNPHLRTSALMVSPAVLNGLGFGPVSSRLDTYEFEHGLSSMYRRLTLNGLLGVVVGRNGFVYGEHDWPNSYTFRRGDQENLIVADGQTDVYMAAGPEERLSLSQMAGWDS